MQSVATKAQKKSVVKTQFKRQGHMLANGRHSMNASGASMASPGKGKSVLTVGEGPILSIKPMAHHERRKNK